MRGGLHNRLTRLIRLLPFTVGETEAFLKSRHVNLTRQQIAELYMTMGGIPHYLKQVERGLSGAQIDLLIDRRDNTINLCEMKYASAPYTIDKSYAENLRQKRDVFLKVTGTRKNVFLTMVTSFGLTDNAYAKELIADSLTLDDLF